MLADTYIFYADVYFIQNFLMKIGILTLTMRTLKLHKTKPGIKIFACATVATLIEILGLFFFGNYGGFVVLSHILELPLMMLVLTQRHREKLGHAIICGYFYVIVINGVIEILWNLIGEGWGYPLLVLFGNIFCVGAIYFGIRWWQLSKGVYPVDIFFPDVIWTTRGFYDSGNHLKDPYTGQSVHIISGDLAKRLELNMEESVKIPFQTVGQEEGWIDIYYIDKIRIKKDDRIIEQQKVPLAVAEDGIFAGKCYEMIMNEDIW